MGRGERNRDIDRGRAVLERIVTLLLSLAMLTDRAAGRSAHTRRHVLDLVAYGEAEAYGLIVAMATGEEPDDGSMTGYCPDHGRDHRAPRDPALLAARLRTLALVLYTMLLAENARPAACGRSDPWPANRPGPSSGGGWRIVGQAPDTG